MAITKPPVLPAWAESGDKVTPSNAEIQVGWPLSSIPPSRQRFNWLLNFLANGIRYFSRRGLPDYDAAETYMTGDRIIGDDGKTYRSLIDNNTAQTPSTSPTKWEEWAPTLSRFAALIQGQTYTAFTTAGAAPNFTLTPSPAIAAYAAGQRFRVKFHAAGAGADVLNVSTLGNKSLKQYDSTGAKVAAVIAANQLADVEYDGVDMVIMDPLPPMVTNASARGLSANLLAYATGLTSSVYVTADELIVENAANNYLTLRNINLASLVTGGAVGANSLDAGAWAFNTFYWLHVIYNPTTLTVAGLFSLSRGAPTLPSGYTYFAPVSVIKTPASTNYNAIAFTQKGTQYVWGRPQQVANALTMNATYSAISVAAAVPFSPCILDVAFGNSNTSPNVVLTWSADGTNDYTPGYWLPPLGAGNLQAQQMARLMSASNGNIFARSQATSTGALNAYVTGFNFSGV